MIKEDSHAKSEGLILDSLASCSWMTRIMKAYAVLRLVTVIKNNVSTVAGKVKAEEFFT